MLNTIIKFPAIKYWVWIATVYLIFMTYKDYKNKGFIDDRHNFVMIGVSISLLSHISKPFFEMLGLILTILIMRFILNKYKLVGEGDINALAWIFLGYGILNYGFLVWFYIYFVLITILYTTLKTKLFKIKHNTPFFLVILLSFWTNNFILGLY